MRMKNIKKTILGAVIITAAVIFCGCRNDTLEIETELPEGSSIDILVRIDETDEDYCDRYAEVLEDAEENIARQFEIEYNADRRRETLAIMDSPRYNYCEDGWRSAYCFCSDVHGVSYTGLDYRNSLDESTIEFADRFGSIKIMEYNANGIVHVSNEVVIAPKDRFGVGKTIGYDPASGQADCRWFIYRKWHGIEPNDPLVWNGLMLLPCWIFFLIMITVFNKQFYKGSSAEGWIVGASLLSVPNVCFTLIFLALRFVPYLNINGRRFSIDDLAALALVDLPWALCIFGFVLIMRKRSKYIDPLNDPYKPVDIDQVNKLNKGLK